MRRHLLPSSLLATTAAALAVAAPAAHAVPPPIPTPLAIHATPAGVVSLDGATVSLHRNGAATPLATLPGGSPWQIFNGQLLAGEGKWIAARGENDVTAGRSTGPLAPVNVSGPAGRAGCAAWHADLSRLTPFAIAAGQLIVPGVGRCDGPAGIPASVARKTDAAKPARTTANTAVARAASDDTTTDPTQTTPDQTTTDPAPPTDTTTTPVPPPMTVPVPPTAATPPPPASPPPPAPPEPAGKRPLFARNLATGRWRVLATLPVGAQPARIGDVEGGVALASAGNLVAVATPAAATTMLVQVLDARTGKVRWHTTLPSGSISLAANGTLVATTQWVNPSSPPARVLVATQKAPKPRVLATDIGYGSTALVSGTTVAYETPYNQADDTSSLVVRDVHTGAERTIVSFRAPMRQLWAFDLRGTQLTWMQSLTPIKTTYTCWQGMLGTTGPRFLQTVDVSRAAPPIPAPAPPPPGPDEATILAQCGPPLPAPAGADAIVTP